MCDPSHLEIPGQVILTTGNGGLGKILVETPWSTAEIYQHGAHITHFQKKGEPPLLFMSEQSAFAANKPIRGGVPIIFPWFGPREGAPAHGIARTALWDLVATTALPDGAVALRFRLPDAGAFEVECLVTVAADLSVELTVANAATEAVTFETCLHTYFEISAISNVTITGLAGVCYLDKVAGGNVTEAASPIRIAGEVDRVYQDTAAAIVIEDPGYERRICIAKSGSNSTVVWNPWIKKSKLMADFGDDEYLRMLCVESGNVANNRITLAPGERTVLKLEVSSKPWV